MKERPILFSAPMVLALLDGRKTQTRRVVKKVLPVGAVDPKRYWGPLDRECIMDRDYLPSSLEGIAWDTNPENERRCGTDLCPYGAPGDRLWLREAWQTGSKLDKLNASEIAAKCLAAGYPKAGAPIRYGADGGITLWGDNDPEDFGPWGRKRHARFMPRWASRITLEITEVRVQRLQEISEADAIAEGADIDDGLECECGWRGYEDTKDVREAGPEEDHHFLCPTCREITAHFPIDEQGRQGFRLVWESINGAGSWDANPWVWALTFQRVEQGARA